MRWQNLARDFYSNATGCTLVDSPDFDEPLSEIEAMVRAAGNYVQPSKDLRPRVLEAARLTSGERRARRFIHQAALVAALLTWCVTASVNRLDMRDDLRELTFATSSAYSISSSRISGATGGAAWTLVDAYTQLRDRQADVLRPKL
jgi:AcrR family transcriptional regulator